MDTQKGIAWPGWEIVRRIGRGSFGTVYEIQRNLYGDIEKGALKVITIPHSEDEVDYLRCSGLDDSSITQTFHQQVGDIAKEYKLMAQLRDNPNIVRCDDFRDIQRDDGLGWDIYIKMELLTPLMKRLELVSSEEQITRMGMDICNALIDCQKQNIIHRDIKPQNVFISQNGRFKLGDFGIARTIERTTHATAGIGTYSYMAPEVERNEPYGKTADIYSLGLMLYWLLNERRGPFMPLPPTVPKYGDEEHARRRRFAGEQIPAPKNGSDKLKKIVLRACNFKPEDRYKNAEEMFDALGELLTKQPMISNHATPASGEENESDEELTVIGPVWEYGPEAEQNTELADEDVTVLLDFAQQEKTELLKPHKAISAQPDAEGENTAVTTVVADNHAESYKAAQTTGPVFGGITNTCDAVPVDNDLTDGLSFVKKSAPRQEPAEEVSHSAADKFEDNSKKRKIYVIGICTLLFLVLCTAVILFYPRYSEWSEWSTAIPEAMDGRKVESMEQYRYREKVLVESEQGSLEGGILVSQKEELSDFGQWGDWQKEKIEEDDMCEVECATRYRSRQIYAGKEYSEWSNWSNWGNKKITKSDLTDVQSRTVYEYNVYRYRCIDGYTFSKCGVMMISVCRKFGSHTEEQLNILREIVVGQRPQSDLSAAGYFYESTVLTSVDAYASVDTSTDPYEINSGGSTWYTNSTEPSGSYTQYRSCTRTLREKTSYSDWSDYTDEVLKVDEDTDVESCVMYRCRTREMVTTYQYRIWGEWSDWQNKAIPEQEDKKVEKKTLYRYAEKYFLWEKLFGSID